MDDETRGPTVKDLLEYIIESLDTIVILKPLNWNKLVANKASRLQEIVDKL